MSEDELLAAGFIKYKPSSHDRYDALYGLRVKDDVGIRYSIHVRFWDFAKYGSGHANGWDVELVSNDGCEWWDGPLWLTTSCHDKTVADVVRWADQMWTKLSLKHYERQLT